MFNDPAMLAMPATAFAVIGILALLSALLAVMVWRLARAKLTLRESAARYRRIVDTAREGIWEMDADYLTVYVNQVMADMLGYERAEMVGRHVTSFMFEEDLQDHGQKMAARVSGLDQSYERRFRRKEGSEVWTRVQATALKDDKGRFLGSFAMFTDITGQKEAEETLRALTSRHQAILEAIPDIIMEVDGNKVYQWANQAGVEFFGGDVLGRTADYYFEGEQDTYGFVRPLFSGDENVIYVESWQRRKDGEKRLLAWWCRVLKDVKGNVAGALSTARDITESKRAEEEIRKQVHFLETLFDTIPNPIFHKDANGRYTGCNRAFLQFTGKPREEVLGKTVYDMGPGNIADQYAEKDRELFEHPGKQHYEWQVQNTLGEVREVLFDKATLLDVHGAVAGLIGVISDITDRKRAEEALLERERTWATLITNLPGFVYRCANDRDWTMEYISEGCRDITGYSPEDFLLNRTMAYNDIVQADYREPLWQKWQEVLPKRESFEEEYPIITAGGQTRWVWERGQGIHAEDGRLLYLEGFITDITDRKRAETERRSLEERLQRAEKMEALGTLAGGVAHDLNNVLGIVVGYAELLSAEVPEASAVSRYVKEIQNGGERAAAIVQDLLTLTRRGVPSRKVLNLNSIIMDCQESTEFAKMLSYHPKVRIKSDFEADLLNISGSALHLGKSFLNLVSNAAEAMPDGGDITIKTGNQYLDKPVSGYDEIREGDYVVLVVSDTGEGIPAADLKRIFEPFYTKKIMGRSGTGLGLAVVWGTVKDHHGYINVESEEGTGTAFTLYFPVTREEISSSEIAVSASEYMGNGESILVVDDVKEQRDLATMMLTRLNYRVASVASGEEAVNHIRRHPVEVVILDMIMDPGMDGLDTYRKILEIRPHQKAIIVSGFSQTDRVTNAQALGAGAYVKKPYVLKNLGLAIKKELDRPADVSSRSRSSAQP